MDAQSFLRAIKLVYASFDLELDLERGASDATIAHLHSVIPDCEPLKPLVDLWRLADGNGEICRPVFVRPDFSTGYDLLSVQVALNQREAMRRRAPRYEGYADPSPRDRRIRPGWWQPGWLPFGAFYGTLLLILDLSPSEHGTPGQVIAFTHDPDEITFIADSFTELLAASAEEFEANGEEVLEGVLAEYD